jgi:hypothetical protein
VLGEEALTLIGDGIDLFAVPFYRSDITPFLKHLQSRVDGAGAWHIQAMKALF